MDICIFYNNGKVETVDNISAIDEIGTEKIMRLFYKDDLNVLRTFSIARADIAMLKIYGGDYE